MLGADSGQTCQHSSALKDLTSRMRATSGSIFYIQLALADGRRENVIPALDGVCVVRKGGTALLIPSEIE
jgi:hypothetical protein